jgi:hypothetical protein
VTRVTVIPRGHIYAYNRIVERVPNFEEVKSMYGHKGEKTSNQLNINNSVYKAHLNEAVKGKSALVPDSKAPRK